MDQITAGPSEDQSRASYQRDAGQSSQRPDQYDFQQDHPQAPSNAKQLRPSFSKPNPFRLNDNVTLQFNQPLGQNQGEYQGRSFGRA
jgi:hypothetical protein